MNDLNIEIAMYSLSVFCILVILVNLVLLIRYERIMRYRYRRGYKQGYKQATVDAAEYALHEAVSESLRLPLIDKDFNGDVKNPYAPDTSDWSPLIPTSTKMKLVEGITAFNKATDERNNQK